MFFIRKTNLSAFWVTANWFHAALNWYKKITYSMLMKKQTATSYDPKMRNNGEFYRLQQKQEHFKL